MRRLILMILTVLSLAASFVPAQTSQAQSGGERCFPETGYCIAGPIRKYWESNGGLAVFGFPTGPQRVETVEGTWTGPVQWFERDRLEDHGNDGVMAGRLGARLLELRGEPWQGWPTVERSQVSNSCTYFDVTKHSLCEPFLSYWRNNGGLARFGYPITEVVEEHSRTWSGKVQYFERRRMEHHTELIGTPYEVLLGLLGNEVRGFEPAEGCALTEPASFNTMLQHAPFRRALGCPLSIHENLGAAFQPFEKGHMLWLNSPVDGKQIYIIHNAGSPAPYRYANKREDTWTSAEPENNGESAPASNLYVPKRGFYKVWKGSRGVGQFIGFGTAPEQGAGARVVYFENGAVVHLDNGDYFAYGPDGQVVNGYLRFMR